MIQVYSCNLLYLSIVMTDGLFEQVSVLVMIPCFLKKRRISFCLLTVLLTCYLFTFAFFKTVSASTPSIVQLVAKMIQLFLHSWAVYTTFPLVAYISPSTKYLRTY